MLLKNIETYVPTTTEEEKDVMSDIRYICKSCSLITESLQKGCDVMQMPNGDIIITMLKPIAFHYSWDDDKGKLVRTQPGNKLRKSKPRKNSASIAVADFDDEDFDAEEEMLTTARTSSAKVEESV